MPVKYEHVVFCNPAPVQTSLYRHFIASPEIKKLLRGTGSQPLKAIGILKKLCNHPELLELPDDLPGCEGLLPQELLNGGAAPQFGGRDRTAGRGVNCTWSGKFLVLERYAFPGCSMLETSIDQ